MGMATVTLNQQMWAFVCGMMTRGITGEPTLLEAKMIEQVSKQAFAEQPEPVYEYGTRVVLPAFPPHPKSVKEYLAGSRENAEADRDAVLSSTKLREVYLIRRQAAGPWEEVK